MTCFSVRKRPEILGKTSSFGNEQFWKLGDRCILRAGWGGGFKYEYEGIDVLRKYTVFVSHIRNAE